MNTPRDKAAPQHHEPQAPRPGYSSLLSQKQGAGVHDVAPFIQHGERPLALMQGTNQSANVLWQSSQTHRAGGLAGYGKANRGTLYDTGF